MSAHANGPRLRRLCSVSRLICGSRRGHANGQITSSIAKTVPTATASSRVSSLPTSPTAAPAAAPPAVPDSRVTHARENQPAVLPLLR